MIQQTSRKAYGEILPHLGEKQSAVYQTFKFYGASTNLEIATILFRPINTIVPRTNELVKMGLLEAKSKEKCSISGRLAIKWAVCRTPKDQEMQDMEQYEMFTRKEIK